VGLSGSNAVNITASTPAKIPITSAERTVQSYSIWSLSDQITRMFRDQAKQ